MLYDICFLMTMMCAGGLAFSGEGKLLEGFLGINYWTTAIITILISAALCFNAMLQQGTSIVGYMAIPVIVIPALTFVAAKVNS